MNKHHFCCRTCRCQVSVQMSENVSVQVVLRTVYTTSYIFITKSQTNNNNNQNTSATCLLVAFFVLKGKLVAKSECWEREIYYDTVFFFWYLFGWAPLRMNCNNYKELTMIDPGYLVLRKNIQQSETVPRSGRSLK